MGAKRLQKKYIRYEWQQMRKAEQKFLQENVNTKTYRWQEAVEKRVPDKLEETLRTAFYKAFEVIFEKGRGMIEKTCGKERRKYNYKVHEYTAKIRGNRKSLQAFHREANAGRAANLALSAVEGVGMGALWMGIPDIPVFLAVLLKNIYEIALSYGFSYDTEEEQIFILRLIEAALSHGEDLSGRNMELNLWIYRKENQMLETQEAPVESDISKEEQMRRTADGLAGELLYLKFVQGLPVIGIAGGISDVVYQKKISQYAQLKYQRRFLEHQRLNTSE